MFSDKGSTPKGIATLSQNYPKISPIDRLNKACYKKSDRKNAVFGQLFSGKMTCYLEIIKK